MNDSRMLMLSALLLDWLGHFLIVCLILLSPDLIGVDHAGFSLRGQVLWPVFALLLYPFLGWLFGSYTVLRWRRLNLPVLLHRLLITAVVTLMVMATARWVINPIDNVWFVSRRVQITWIVLLSIWSLIVRIVLRQGLLFADSPDIFLLANPQELKTILDAWRRVPQRKCLRPVEPMALGQLFDQAEEPILVALSLAVLQDPALLPLLSDMEMRDSRQVHSLSVWRLFEQHQERLPPVLFPDTLLSYDDLPWAATFSVQAQLKRIADLLVAAVLLLLTAPFVLFAGLLIWVEDRGPILFAQQRSGWLGRPFTVYKLRTMTVQPADSPARWTLPGDQRITSVGSWLRRLRLDELPQLLNVLNGEMSLIGPRPERPELEEELEKRIPHYRKRHWMRPGLSGWAQVCAPYASSIEDSDLKLSYDLYYLRNFSTWLDLVILFQTVKTVLKAGGR